MNLSLQELVAKVKSSRETLIALVCVTAVVAVLAMVMAFRGSAGQQFIGAWRVRDSVNGGVTTVHIYRTADGFALQAADPKVLPVPYRLENGRLVPAPGYENCCVISLAGKILVMTPPSDSAPPRHSATPAPVLSQTTQPAPVLSSTTQSAPVLSPTTQPTPTLSPTTQPASSAP